MRILLSIILSLTAQMSAALEQPTTGVEIAPAGSLRTAVIGIPVLGGIAEPVGRFIAGKLGVSFAPVVYSNPEAYEQSFGKKEWDIAIGPRVLAPVEKADSTADLWLIDLMYLAGV